MRATKKKTAPGNTIIRWSADHDATITTLWNQGVEPAVIAGQLSLPTIAVIDRALRLKLAPVHHRAKAVLSARALAHRSLPVIGPARTCRFIEGDPVQLVRRGEKVFCEAPSIPNSSYCARHNKICYAESAPPTASMVQNDPLSKTNFRH